MHAVRGPDLTSEHMLGNSTRVRCRRSNLERISLARTELTLDAAQVGKGWGMGGKL